MNKHLITHLKAKGFMGKNIDETIAQKTIFTGNNTVGKSTRANLIAITILGFSPFSTKTNKKSNDILNDFGDGKKMITEITCGGVIFERKFTRSEKGSVSNKMRVDKKGSTKSEFDVALSHAGAPKIIDLNDFLGMSDAKRIDSLFSIYPPGADLTNLDSNIEKSKKKISRLNESIKDAGGAIKKLIESKTAIELPAGTLAETQKSIEDLTKGVLEAQNALKIAEEKNAAELKASEPVENTQDKADKMMEENTVPFVADPGPSDPGVYVQGDDGMLKNIDNFSPEKPPEGAKTGKELDPDRYGGYEHNVNSNMGEDKPFIMNVFKPEHVQASIQKILATMRKTDCQMCAAGMTAKIELRKYKGGAE